ncbi:unnamed protein product [Ostreobium quekettii]|uniref:Uncharacterized protein n=1 Tax=Ostreobium quekettii TaxID=121088 RepID=A0A8S1JED1_9CHLO|nr:unnamed protein product [Ostreobium quekettii]
MQHWCPELCPPNWPTRSRPAEMPNQGKCRAGCRALPLNTHSFLAGSFLFASLGWPRLGSLGTCAVLHVQGANQADFCVLTYTSVVNLQASVPSTASTLNLL